MTGKELDATNALQKERENKLGPLPEAVQRNLCSILSKSAVAEWSLDDLRADNVPVDHVFQLTENKPIYSPVRLIPPKQHKRVQEEFQKMLEAGMIVHSVSSWSFPIFIATMKDGKRGSAWTTALGIVE